MTSAPHSLATERKVRRRATDDGLPARGLRTLLAGLSTLTRNETRVEGTEITFEKYARPTPLQEKAFELRLVPPVASTAYPSIKDKPPSGAGIYRSLKR